METRKKVIIVDDVNYCLATVKNGLDTKYEVYPAPSVAKMFEILNYVKPDVIVMDVNMPGINGYEAIKQLKADKRYSDIPVIFLTSEKDRNSVMTGFKLGAADYVAKPFAPTVLIERIEFQLNPETRNKTLNLDTGRKKIIYVDDMNYNLVSVKSRLESRYEVYSTQYVDKMFEMLDKITPDLIMLDLNMPEIDGFEALVNLKSDERYTNIPVIILTGRTDKESVDKSFKKGAADYVTKPFTDEDLINRIEFLLTPKKRVLGKPDDDDLTKPLILAVDETYSMLNAVGYALADDYNGPLRDSVRKNFVVYFTLRDNFRVSMVSKNEEVAQFLKANEPDGFMIDCKFLTGESDSNLVSVIRSHKECEETPIIVLTLADSIDHLSESVREQVCDFVTKPPLPRELREKAAKYVKKKGEEEEEAPL